VSIRHAHAAPGNKKGRKKRPGLAHRPVSLVLVGPMAAPPTPPMQASGNKARPSPDWSQFQFIPHRPPPPAASETCRPTSPTLLPQAPVTPSSTGPRPPARSQGQCESWGAGLTGLGQEVEEVVLGAGAAPRPDARLTSSGGVTATRPPPRQGSPETSRPGQPFRPAPGVPRRLLPAVSRRVPVPAQGPGLQVDRQVLTTT